MVEVPASFRAMPRWWHDEAGRAWLADLPAVVERACTRLGVAPDGRPLHGSNALVVPVRRGGEPLALRLAPPDDGDALETALRTWDGRGVVRLVDEDRGTGGLLLERLDATDPLASRDVGTRIDVLAALTRRLAVPVPSSVRSTAEVAAEDGLGFSGRWEALGAPVAHAQLEAAIGAARELSGDPGPLEAVNGDLHAHQVLAGRREPWLVVDPVLLRGHREYDVGRVLWTNLDDLPGEARLRGALIRFARVAGVPHERAVAWTVVRAMSYLLWGLERGLTEDPVRCRRLLDVFA